MKLLQMKLLFTLFYFSVALVFVSCGTKKDKTPVAINKSPDYSTGEGKYTFSAEIVQHSFINKFAKVTDRKEYYVRRSMQDYFIKFCESAITEVELEKFLQSKSGIGSSFKMEVEIKEGFFDSCNDDELIQSRTGVYIIINQIIE